MRRPKLKRQRRTVRTVVLLSAEEHLTLDMAARRAGMPLSTWLRWLGLTQVAQGDPT